MPPGSFHHEDDSLRAVRLAMTWVEKLKEINHEIRVGITTGKVFCGTIGTADRAEYTLYGNDVNMSARLMANKVNTGILVDEDTWNNAKGAIDFEVLDPVPIKGSKALMPVYKPLKTKRLESRVQARRRPQLSTG